jgi:Uma2 family endonuclease
MATERTTLTFDDYLAMSGEDGLRYEILDGELHVSPTPVPLHQLIVLNLCLLLGPYVRAHSLGQIFVAPITVVLARTSVVVPDVVYVAADRAGLVTARAIEGAPTLLVEVASPSTRHLDRRRKFELYARHGVPYYWMVETDERVIEAYELAGGAYRLALRAAGEAPVSLPPFPALSFAPEALWRP